MEKAEDGSPKQIGKPFPVKPPRKTIKYKKYADIVSIKDPESARESVGKLWEEFNNAHTREKKVGYGTSHCWQPRELMQP